MKTAPAAKKFTCPVAVEGAVDQRCPDGCCGEVIVAFVNITSPKTGRVLQVSSEAFNEVMSLNLVVPYNVAGSIVERRRTTMDFTAEQLRRLVDRA